MSCHSNEDIVEIMKGVLPIRECLQTQCHIFIIKFSNAWKKVTKCHDWLTSMATIFSFMYRISFVLQLCCGKTSSMLSRTEIVMQKNNSSWMQFYERSSMVPLTCFTLKFDHRLLDYALLKTDEWTTRANYSDLKVFDWSQMLRGYCYYIKFTSLII